MVLVGDTSIGQMFLYKKALFVALPMDWNLERYFYLCVATRNREEFEVGEEYSFDEQLEVEIVSDSELKNLIPKS